MKISSSPGSTRSFCRPSEPSVLQRHHKLPQRDAVDGVGVFTAEHLQKVEYKQQEQVKHLEEHVLDVEERRLVSALLSAQHHGVLVGAVVLHRVGGPGHHITLSCHNLSAV